MVDGAPEIKELAIDLHNDLVQMPAQLRIGSHLHDLPLSDLGVDYRPKPVPPKPDGLVADLDPTLGADVWRERTDDWLKKAGAAFCAGALAMVRRCGWPIRDAGRAQRCALAARSRPTPTSGKGAGGRTRAQLARLDCQILGAHPS